MITPKVLKKVLRNYERFYALVRDGHCDTLQLEGGDEVNFWDLFMGFNTLSPKQKEAVYLHILLDLDGKTVARIMGYNHERGADVVREYANHGLRKLCKFHNEG